jgi:transposase-like protein
MTAPDSLPLHALTVENLASASPDLLRQMVKVFADALMSADADAACNAAYGQVSEDRVNQRNGYRLRGWDTPPTSGYRQRGTIELAIPKLGSGSYFPTWLLGRRRRAEQALISVVATAYLIGVSTRRVEKLAESLGVTPTHVAALIPTTGVLLQQEVFAATSAGYNLLTTCTDRHGLVRKDGVECTGSYGVGLASHPRKE